MKIETVGALFCVLLVFSSSSADDVRGERGQEDAALVDVCVATSDTQPCLSPQRLVALAMEHERENGLGYDFKDTATTVYIYLDGRAEPVVIAFAKPVGHGPSLFVSMDRSGVVLRHHMAHTIDVVKVNPDIHRRIAQRRRERMEVARERAEAARQAGDLEAAKDYEEMLLLLQEDVRIDEEIARRREGEEALE